MLTVRTDPSTPLLDFMNKEIFVKKNHSILQQLLAVAALFLGFHTSAQIFPDKPIQILVPFSSGTITDNIARTIATRLSERIKQPVLVESKPGAGGIIAMKALQSAKPDGYTLGLIGSGSTTGPWTVKDFPFDVRKDFQMLTLMYAGPLVLVVPPQLPVSNIAEFIQYMKMNPSKAFYGSSGVGTTTHLAIELLKQSASFEMTHIPFKGSSEVYTNMISGGVNAYFDLFGTAKTMMDAGRAKVIGVGSKNRMQILPQTTSISEHIPGFEVSGWVAFAVTQGTPKDIVEKLVSDLRAVILEPEFQQRLRGMGVEPGGNTSSDMTRFVVSEYEKWKNVTSKAGIKPE
ncbi:MAG: tripartite tricarboxylate transporter substrate binding protein [Betaproteobacteria bacterium]|nr:tripartite tricarboxylate transporter substrate binding protein [Betaproteobacteria bacterium]